MGCIPPREGFLEAIVDRCDRAGAVAIFDEVMTGSRLSRGGAQQRFGVRPSLTCLGKVVGGGMPLAVYGGKREIMQKIAPSGPVYQAGTLSGNPLAVSAGLATLELLTDEIYERLEAMGARLEAGLDEALKATGVRGCVQRVGSMLTLFFHEGPVESYADAASAKHELFGTWHRGLIER